MTNKICLRIPEELHQEFLKIKYELGINLSQFCRDSITQSIIKLRKNKNKLAKKHQRKKEFDIKIEERKQEAYYYNIPTNMFKNGIKSASNCILAHEPIDMNWQKDQVKSYKKAFKNVLPYIYQKSKEKFENIEKKITNEKWLMSYFDGVMIKELKYASKFGYIQNKSPKEVIEKYGLRLAEQHKQKQDALTKIALMTNE